MARALGAFCALLPVLPAGTVLSIRLSTEVSSRSHPGSPIEAVVTVPVVLDGREAVGAGAVVRGVVVDARRKAHPDGRALLELRFNEISAGGTTVPIDARLAAVDNARESVDADGVIHGLKPLRARPGKVEDVLILAAHAHPIVLATMEATKLILSRAMRPEIDYRPGVDMTARLVAPAELPAPLASDRAPVDPLPVTADLEAVVSAQPLFTTSANGRTSDMTNLLFAATEDGLHAAFFAAGWFPAKATTLRTEAATFLAVAERHAYHEGPVSVLLLDGRKPDLVFQKQNNTFAMRHHIRIWRRPQAFLGLPVWVGAATHDTGIVFSREAHTFTHRVEPDVDLERSKVSADLSFAGAVAAAAVVPRPGAPTEFANATGDHLSTDGAMCVLVLSRSVGQNHNLRLRERDPAARASGVERERPSGGAGR